jgi:N-acetyl-gamma-glutamyl-phosphate reductase
MIKAGIVGGTGYTAGELLRLLNYHTEVTVDFIYSTSKAGRPVSEVHTDLLGVTDINFSATANTNVDVLFLCLGHGNSKAFLEKYTFADNTRIIDLSNDFRLHADAAYQNKKFVYGLPELQKIRFEMPVT